MRCSLLLTVIATATAAAAGEPVAQIEVTVDRGADVGQAFGSLFEITSADGSVTAGAGFQNGYNTRYRADRHTLQLFVRTNRELRQLVSRDLGRPNSLCGTYLYSRDGEVYSTYGDPTRWDSQADQWAPVESIGGTEETMRLGDDILSFGDSTVKFNEQTILPRPAVGSYQLFFYSDGWLCFYHVNRGPGGYRPYRDDQDGFSRLYACPWTRDEPLVDLSQAITLTLPVVGETTFAWGQLGDQIVTGSNCGGFYVFQEGAWTMLRAPNLGVSYQLYSTLEFEDRLLMGHYPTGRLFQYDGNAITDLAGWPPTPADVSPSAREAQTTTIYGGELFVGIWPWAELWRYNPGDQAWSFARRMFDHPPRTPQVTHPYDEENRGHAIGNLWGQRVTSLIPAGTGLYLSTSAKTPAVWDPAQYPFLAPDQWQSYGAVHALTLSGQLAAPARWTREATRFEFRIGPSEISLIQDGQELARAPLSDTLQQQLAGLATPSQVRWGQGVFGDFGGKSLEGTLR